MSGRKEKVYELEQSPAYNKKQVFILLFKAEKEILCECM